MPEEAHAEAHEAHAEAHADAAVENKGFKEVKWMWESPGGYWKFYSAEENDKIEQAFLCDYTSVEIENDYGCFSIHFDTMTQKGLCERKVHRVAIL